MRHTKNQSNRRSRRGVLLLVVLSMLVLFMLVGTTFLITSNQYRTASKIVEKAGRTTFQPADVLERALMQLVRDTNNRHSALRYHSLLRDYYGVDGFVGRVNGEALPAGVQAVAGDDFRPRYSGASPTLAEDLGPTRGQLIDFFVQDFEDRTLGEGVVLDDANAVGLDLDNNGLPIEHGLSRIDDYYNGCLLTILAGPLRGQSVRVIDYDHIRTETTASNGAVENIRTTGRFRVVAPRRQDGGRLLFVSGTPVLADFLESNGVGHPVMVNGRPLNGTGVGFNALAGPGQPTLTALTALEGPNGDWYGVEHALAPNSTQFVTDLTAYLNPSNRLAGGDPFTAGLTNAEFAPLEYVAPGGARTPLYNLYPGPGGADESYDAADFQNLFLALQAPRSRRRGRVVDASNRKQDPAAYYTSSGRPAPLRLDLEGVTVPSLHRPALANFWFHRLWNSQWLTDQVGDAQERARAILLPYDASGLPQHGLDAASAAQITAIKRRFMLRPLREDHPDFDGSNPLSRYGVGASPVASDGHGMVNTTTGEITFPHWEAVGPWDVDNDGDGQPDSIWADLGLPIQQTEDGRLYKPLVAILCVDLDGRLNLNAHGSTEHFVNDDLDLSTLNRNLAQDFFNGAEVFTSNQLPHGEGWGPADITLRPLLSPDLPGYDALNGTGLSSNAQYDDYSRLMVGRPDPETANRNVARAVDLSETWGRYGLLETVGGADLYWPGVTFDRTGFDLRTIDPVAIYDFAGHPLFAQRIGAQILQFATGQLRLNLLNLGAGQPRGFGRAPDLRSRFSSGIVPTGALLDESVSDFFNVTLSLDTPYEIDLSDAARRRPPAELSRVRASYAAAQPINDDAPFSPAELERLLRAFDADAEKLPGRLWNLVDAFDPEKLVVQNAIADGSLNADSQASNWSPSTLREAVAQSEAAINRRQVTTESWDPPVPNENWTARLLLGADGLPGAPYNDDDGDGVIDEGDETAQGTFTPTSDADPLNDCDDYQVVMGVLPPSGARITDYLRYRIVLELKRQNRMAETFSFDPAVTNALQIDQANALINGILYGQDDRNVAFTRARNLVAGSRDRAPADVTAQPPLFSFGGLLAPETLAGLKMNLNRPFGDGRDNNGNGVVDEPLEAGEPWVDVNGDGAWTVGEPYLDLDGDGRFYVNTDGNNILDQTDWRDFDGDGVSEPIVDSLRTREPGELLPMDYTRGADANGRGAFVDGDGDDRYTAGEAIVRDDNRMARQLYARHLYCLMLSVVDENYLAPYDENDPQVMHYLDPRSGFLGVDGLPTAGSGMAYRLAFELARAQGFNNPYPPDNDTQQLRDIRVEARRRAMRKLTCRQIAQWAINCVDMRDPDSIQTPFEYDENPWDGWNVVDTNGTAGDLTDDNVYPLDGDLTTDENDFMVRRVTAVGFGAPERLYRDNTTATSDDRIAFTDQTRGVVWGAERPELLMTEGLAMHDRRLSDEALAIVDGEDPGSADASKTLTDGGLLESQSGFDDDLDQRTRPRGSAFVELYNPWPGDNQAPRELYSRQRNYRMNADTSGGDPYAPYRAGEFFPTAGVALDRLSNGVGVRRDPARVGHNDTRMEVDRDGYRIRPYTPGATRTDQVIPNNGGNFTISAASPVWRIICVEEHPDIRNAVPNDNPANPTGKANETVEDTPWVYSTRFTTGGSLPGSGTFGEAEARMPSAYRDAAGAMAQSANAQQAGNGVTVTIDSTDALPYLQPDPDWPEFDRFARPFARDNTGEAELVDTPVSYFREDEFSEGQNVVREAKRIQLIKPDRFIERAFYFIGPPETPIANNDLGPVLTRQRRRNLTQPGLLVPDLTVSFYSVQDTYDAVTTLIESDLDPDWLTSIPNPGEQEYPKVMRSTFGGEFWIETEPRIIDPNRPAIVGDRYGSAFSGNRFVSTDRFDADGLTSELNADVEPSEESLPLAPVLPGRYAVIGTAGTTYEYDPDGLNVTDSEQLVKLTNRYTTLFSRLIEATGTSNVEIPSNDPADATGADWARLRRIEMIPSPDFNRHQVIVRFNGSLRNPDLIDGVLDRNSSYANLTDGNPNNDGVRSSEVIDGGGFLRNATEMQFAADAFDAAGNERVIQPVVAVPIDGFSISDPIDNYLLRRAELTRARVSRTSPPIIRLAPTRTNPESETRPVGVEDKTAGYDQPFDFLEELVADQTTPNYRTLHLQRLANPLLAWNPPPRRPGGEANPEHDPSRPVNPYMTVDSLPMDLYAYNGAQPLAEQQNHTADKRPFASKERGLDPHNRENQRANHSRELNRAVEDLTPRDLWRAFSRTANSVFQLQYTGDPADPLQAADRFDLTQAQRPPVSPDAVFFDNNNGPLLGSGSGKEPYDVEVQHSLGFANRGAGRLLTNRDFGGRTVATLDQDGDRVAGDLVGAPSVRRDDVVLDDNNNNKRPTDDDTFAALHWPNRPFTSEMELLQVPAWSSSRMLTYYSTFNHLDSDRASEYDGNWLVGLAGTGPDITGDGFVDARDLAAADPLRTNRLRWRSERAPFGHLLNFFNTASGPAQVLPWKQDVRDPGDPNADPPIPPREPNPDIVGVIAYGAAHYYRVLDYVHAPSRFAATDTRLSTAVFGQPVAPGDPRTGLLAPFNRVDHYRQPGRVNLNTAVGRVDENEQVRIRSQQTLYDGLYYENRPESIDQWSAVYDGLMHRWNDFTQIVNNQLQRVGHLGPAWRDWVVSRRGYSNSVPRLRGSSGFTFDYSSHRLHPNFPTLFANPLQSPGGALNVPVDAMRRAPGSATMLRAHFIGPNADGAWGDRYRDDAVLERSGDSVLDRDFVFNDAGEAALATTNAGLTVDVLLARLDSSVPATLPSDQIDLATNPNDVPHSARCALQPNALRHPTPAFAGASTEASLNTERNPSLRYQPMARLANLATNRSGVFAIWITVGYFEVKPAHLDPVIAQRYSISDTSPTPADPDARAEFFRIYQEGYTIGQEIDLDIGSNQRARGFYVVDRTLPVAFKPGDDANVENAILLRRRIE